MNLYLILTILALLSQNDKLPNLNPFGAKNLEQAIINGDFSYVNKNLQALTTTEKAAYLEISNKQLDLLSEQSKSYWPNRRDTGALIFGLLFLKASKNEFNKYRSLLNDKNLALEAFKSAELTKVSKNISNKLVKALIEVPYLRVQLQFTFLIEALIWFCFFYEMAFDSHYKNLNSKNRLAIHQLIERALIQEKNLSDTKQPGKTFKEKATESLKSLTTMCLNFKEQALNKIKSNAKIQKNQESLITSQ